MACRNGVTRPVGYLDKVGFDMTRQDPEACVDPIEVVRRRIRLAREEDAVDILDDDDVLQVFGGDLVSSTSFTSHRHETGGTSHSPAASDMSMESHSDTRHIAVSNSSPRRPPGSPPPLPPPPSDPLSDHPNPALCPPFHPRRNPHLKDDGQYMKRSDLALTVSKHTVAPDRFL